MAINLPIISTFDNKGIKQAESAIGKFGKVAGGIAAAATAAVAGVAVASVKAFADFDSQLNKSVAIMGDVSDVMRGQMSDAAREVAKTTTFSAAQAAESYFFLASAGLDAEASIGALPVVAKFAQAGMFDMAQATDLLTDAQSALGLTSEDTAENLENMSNLADILVKANTLANASVEQFSSALTNKAAASMRTLGIETEAGVAVLAVFADQGLKGEAAGTAFNATLEGLTRTARLNAGAYKALGVEVFDSTGELNNMADIVAQLEKGMDGMSTEQVNATLASLGLTRQALDGTKALLGNSEAIREYEGELRNAAGTVDEVAGKQLETFEAQLALLQSRVQDVGIAIGGPIVDLLLTLMEDLGPVFDILGTLMVDMFDQLTPVIGQLIDFLPPLLQAFAPLIPIIGKIAETVMQVVTLALPPLITLFEKLMPIFQVLIEKLLPVFVNLFELLMPVIDELATLFADVLIIAFEFLVPILMDLIEALMPLAQDLFPVITDIIKKLAPIIVTMLEAFMPLVNIILPIIIRQIEILIPFLVFLAEIFGKILVYAIEVLAGFVKFLGERFADFGTLFVDVFTNVQKFFAGIVNGMIGLFEGFINGVIDGINWLIRKINTIKINVPATPFNEAFTMGFDFRELERISIPRIQLAEGGIVTKATRALIGEAGPEAVIPLDKMGGMGNTYNITVNAGVGVGNGAQVGEAIVAAIKKYERSSGPVFASA
jgi:TP901 family phage tail tape measure protein